MNIPTFIVIVILIVLVALALKSIFESKVKGCSYGCTNCTGSCNAFKYTREAIEHHKQNKKV